MSPSTTCAARCAVPPLAEMQDEPSISGHTYFNRPVRLGDNSRRGLNGLEVVAPFLGVLVKPSTLDVPRGARWLCLAGSPTASVPPGASCSSACASLPRACALQASPIDEALEQLNLAEALFVSLGNRGLVPQTMELRAL